MYNKILCGVRKINLMRHVCNHLVGRDHTFSHRAIAGVVVMASGVAIAHCGAEAANQYVAGLFDCVGYGLHGAGLTPFVEAMISASEI